MLRRAGVDSRPEGVAYTRHMNQMNNVLLTAGVASIILAVVGGGAKAFGVEVPVLDKRGRQISLALVGVLFLAASFAFRPNGDDGESAEVKAYRQEVLASCRSLQGAGADPILAAGNEDGTFDRGRLIEALRGQVTASGEVLDELWGQPVPEELQNEAHEAQKTADSWLARTRKEIGRVRSRVPARFTFQQMLALLGQLNTALRAPASRLDGALSRLAGRQCAVPAPNSSP